MIVNQGMIHEDSLVGVGTTKDGDDWVTYYVCKKTKRAFALVDPPNTNQDESPGYWRTATLAELRTNVLDVDKEHLPLLRNIGVIDPVPSEQSLGSGD